MSRVEDTILIPSTVYTAAGHFIPVHGDPWRGCGLGARLHTYWSAQNLHVLCGIRRHFFIVNVRPAIASTYWQYCVIRSANLLTVKPTRASVHYTRECYMFVSQVEQMEFRPSLLTWFVPVCMMSGSALEIAFPCILLIAASMSPASCTNIRLQLASELTYSARFTYVYVS